MSGSSTINQARIDIPLKSTWMFLFVEADNGQWDPWWNRLFANLLSIPADPNRWRHNPEQNVYVNFPILSESDKATIAEWLRSAPQQEVEGHRTLQRAVQLTAEKIPGLRLAFFSDVRPIDEPGDASSSGQ